MDEQPTGFFCWNELATTDADAAIAFYGGLFGWTTSSHDMGGGHGPYHIIQAADGREIGGIYKLFGEMVGAVPPHWLSYVRVEDVDALTKRATELGGGVILPPLDIPGRGRMSVLRDREGGTIALFQEVGGSAAPRVMPAHGTFCWNELISRDVEAAKAFYGGLLGWEAHEQDFGPMRYVTWMHGDQPAGGCLLLDAKEAAGMPACWVSYAYVDDCDATVAKVAELGGSTLEEPRDIPMVGRFAVVRDPQGAVFSIIRLVER